MSELQNIIKYYNYLVWCFTKKILIESNSVVVIKILTEDFLDLKP